MFYLDFEEKLEKFDMEIQSLIKLSKESDIDIDGKIIDIEKNNLRFRAFTATGELFDEFLLQKQSNKPNKLIEK